MLCAVSVPTPEVCRLSISISLKGNANPQQLRDQVARQIEALVVESDLLPGDRLGSERALCERFQVSRTLLREAIRTLESKGVVTVIPARGLFVGSGGLASAIDALSEGMRREALSYSELLEGRRFLETRIGEFAAARRSDAQAVELLAHVERLSAELDRPEAFLKEDLQFHLDLSRASGNRLFEIWLQPILENLIETRQSIVLLRPVRLRIVECHRRIAQAIVARDPVMARSAIVAHMDQFADDSDLARSMGFD